MTGLPERTAEPAGLPDGPVTGRQLESPAGFCFLVERVFQEPLRWQPASLAWLWHELELVAGIGPRTASSLRDKGISHLTGLTAHERFGPDARRVLHSLENRDILALLNRGVSDADLISFFQPHEIVFVDIETTSLYNTQPLFLVGLLSAGENSLTLRQYLARCYEEERAVLESVFEHFAKYRALVSYNGRSFDLPYLNSRGAYHGMVRRFSHIHLDLLHQTRRRFRGKWPNCRLTTAEEQMLGEERGEDLPGALVPQLYHEYVHSRDPGIIAAILDHNARDLLTLARLLPHLA